MPKPVHAIRYVTCWADAAQDLDRQVTTLLTQGWSLWGNPYGLPDPYPYSDKVQYCQAMIQLFEE